MCLEGQLLLPENFEKCSKMCGVLEKMSLNKVVFGELHPFYSIQVAFKSHRIFDV